MNMPCFMYFSAKKKITIHFHIIILIGEEKFLRHFIKLFYCWLVLIEEVNRENIMGKLFNEFTSSNELDNHIKYWSNACGDLHHHGEYDLENASELPLELQRAYAELWREGDGYYE